MVLKRILIVESGRFIGGVIKDILTERQALQVTSINPVDCAELRQAIADFNPDVLVVDDTMQNSNLEGLLLTALRMPRLRVILVHANQNNLQVFDTQRVEVGRLEDFLAVF